MDYTLMHKNIPVVDMDILSETGNIIRLYNLQTPEHLPVATGTKDGASLKEIDKWWSGRSIPASRDGLRDALEAVGISSTAMLLEKCYGLSLSDQYWICPKGSGLAWKDVNFFQNEFSKDVGEILFGHAPKDRTHVSLVSPDNTSDGVLRKKWIIVDGKRVLMKGGSGYFHQQPFNEAVASAVMRRLGVIHVPYTVTVEKDKPYSLCENFVTPDTELVSASRIWRTQEIAINRSAREHFFACCDVLRIPGVKNALDRMLTVDYIIANEDRHLNNFGVLRNAQTLEYLSFAPIFDSGTSLWHDKRVGAPIKCRPFCNTHEEQIKQVENLRWFNPDTLKDLDEEIMDIFVTASEVDESRRMTIASAVMARVQDIQRLQKERRPSILAALRQERQDIPAPSARVRPKGHER